MKRTLIPIIGCAALTLSFSSVAEKRVQMQSNHPTEEQDRQYAHDLEQVRADCRAGSIPALSATMAGIAAQWSTWNQHSLVNLLRAACDQIASTRFADNEGARALLHQYATLAFEKADDSLVDVRLHLLTSHLRVHERLIGLKVADFVRERRLSAEQWVKAWNRVDDLLDCRWDPGRPEFQVRPFIPPAHVPFRAGLAPERIADPKVRAEYEAHLERSHEVAEGNKLQRKLRKIKADDTGIVERYLIELYSMPPTADDEFKALVNTLKDEPLRERILAARQTGSNGKP